MAKSQLRKSEEAINIFNRLQGMGLVEIGAKASDFKSQVELQLAFAQIKTYKDAGYEAAEAILNNVTASAEKARDAKLHVQAKSLQAFLYAVMAGRSAAQNERPRYAARALEVSAGLLNSPAIAAEARFEALNALGITWMRIAEGTSSEDKSMWQRNDWQKLDPDSAAWQKAERSYRDAMAIVPNSVRTLQNFATMRLAQARLAPEEKRSALRKEAKEAVLLSLGVNNHDQFPYSQLAEIEIENGNSENALHYIEVGRTRSGSVRPEEWKALLDRVSRASKPS